MTTNDTGVLLNDILFSVAQGLADAQDRLNMLEPFDMYGRPNPQYHIPYLDFDIKIDFSKTTETSGGLAAQEVSPSLSRLPMVAYLARPSGSSKSTISQTSQSTIKGRFVSVPPEDGAPQRILKLSVSADQTTQQYQLTASVQLATGEPVSNALVEFNVNEDMTYADNGNAKPPLENQKIFQSGSEISNPLGIANNVVHFNQVDSAIHSLHIDINVGLTKTALRLERI